MFASFCSSEAAPPLCLKRFTACFFSLSTNFNASVSVLDVGLDVRLCAVLGALFLGLTGFVLGFGKSLLKSIVFSFDFCFGGRLASAICLYQLKVCPANVFGVAFPAFFFGVCDGRVFDGSAPFDRVMG